jgi:hypothetical protein
LFLYDDGFFQSWDNGFLKWILDLYVTHQWYSNTVRTRLKIGFERNYT